MKILELCEGERPREKMKSLGANALSNGELLAILLRNGRRGESVLDLAQRLLSGAEGSLGRLFSMRLSDLKAIPGIGPEKACSVLAACELGRRFMLEGAGVEKRPVTSARMIYELMLPRLKGVMHEEFWAMYFNVSWYYLGCERITTGSGNATTFDVRSVVKGALDCSAYAVAIVHNHPSCNPRPSQADIQHTQRLRDACSRFELAVLDHVIVADDCFYSFHEERRYER
ncbi:MAG: DNA repair protein RadC [Bacteroidales bacterium]|nr:DNA repair protein RadC [Bacteroidales bacterium]